MRPEDTFEGQALIQEQAYLDSHPPHALGGKPCHLCGGDHSNPRDRLIAQLIAALRPLAAAAEWGPDTSDLDNEQPVRVTLGDVRRAWAALAAAGER